jgi:hypothetical protein
MTRSLSVALVAGAMFALGGTLATACAAQQAGEAGITSGPAATQGHASKAERAKGNANGPGTKSAHGLPNTESGPAAKLNNSSPGGEVSQNASGPSTKSVTGKPGTESGK